MNEYSREVWSGFGMGGTLQSSRQEEACHVDDRMADTASSNVSTDDKIHSYKRTLQGDSVLQALCQEINFNAEESRRQRSMAGHAKPRIMQEMHEVIPSGKRKQGEGCEDDQQGILEAFWNNDGRAVLRITLLAAGFVIGPKGQSIRDISKVSGARIRSWNDNFVQHGKMRRVRQIVIEGRVTTIVHALTIIRHAVERYRELYEGGYCNQFVDPIQLIMGVEFTYSPPPRKAVPYAAGIKTKASSRGKDQNNRRPHEDMNLYRVSQGVTVLSSESDQSYHSSWSREEPSLALQSDERLGLFETPCEVYNPRPHDYGHGLHAPRPRYPSNTYTMFGNHSNGHLESYPWYEMDMLENATVRSLNSRPSLIQEEACHSLYAPHGGRSLARCKETTHLFPSREQPYRHRTTPLWNLEPSPRKNKENHLYENMFAEFGHKCHVSDNAPAQHVTCDLATRLTPKQNRLTPNQQEESPVHFKFEVTVDSSKGKEAKRKLIFEE